VAGLRRIAFAFGLSGTKVCACGRVWDLVKHKTRETDSESVECKCGRTLKRWNGACFWLPRLVKDIDEPHQDSFHIPPNLKC